MGLPRKLKNFATFVDGVNYMGETPEVTLPTLSRKMEEYRSGGMNGTVSLDLGQEKMEAEIKAAGWQTELLASFGAGTHDAVLLRFAGAIQSDDSEAVQAVEVVMRGRLQEAKPDNIKAGDMTNISYKYPLSYYKLTVNGEVRIEIDLVNLVEVVNGDDRLAAVRTALGI
ncbi:MAG: phage major tail tube protein [Desulfovibrionaceae bacterium]|jgi:P2 family phage contractile tail tube protein|nr:phage major tail tube protein [Desulfovibrionaceae bacterium]